MISIILYGRNDNYGHNLSKRAAISINCMAEVLDALNDEIIFVDYNTPDYLPTFPESISDTLTKKAKSLLRIFRVRPNFHNKLYGKRTHLKIPEPICRNVGIRRSNPLNKWILSTNTDMIFITHSGRTLSKEILDLKDGYYIAPRIEIPLSFWESFDRLNAIETIQAIPRIAQDNHLNEIVYGPEYNLYDAPGDFQLIRRSDIFELHGFNEEMIFGWHVDSNMSKRLYLKYGEVGNAGDFVYGYHCEHTLEKTLMHAPNHTSNNLKEFVDDLNSAILVKQKDIWGLNHEKIEEISLKGETSIASEYVGIIKCSQMIPVQFDLYSKNEHFKKTSSEHIFPHLINTFKYQKKGIVIGWLGKKDDIFKFFQAYGKKNGIQIIDKISEKNQISFIDIFILNFGAPDLLDGEEENLFRMDLRKVLLDENLRFNENTSPRMFIALNSIGNRFDEFLRKFFHFNISPLQAHVRYCFCFFDKVNSKILCDYTEFLKLGSSGIRKGNIIRSTRHAGLLFIANDLGLEPGKYRFTLKLASYSIFTFFDKFELNVYYQSKCLYTKTFRILSRNFQLIDDIYLDVHDHNVRIELKNHFAIGRVRVLSLLIQQS